jgi:hypothetical protein
MRASSIGHLTGVQLPYGMHLIGVRLGLACGSHRTYISQTCALDRCATLTGHTLTEHVSYGRSDFGPPQSGNFCHLPTSLSAAMLLPPIGPRSAADFCTLHRPDMINGISEG